MTNGEIAAQLIVGETTVKTHVTRILMKLVEAPATFAGFHNKV